VELANLASSSRSEGFSLEAAQQMGLALCFHGELSAARIQLEKVAEPYRPNIHGASAFLRGGTHFAVGATTVIGGFVLPVCGFPDEALIRCQQSLDLAAELNHPYSKAFALWGFSRLLLTRGELSASNGHADSVLSIAGERGFKQFFPWISVLKGEICLKQQKISDAISGISKGIDGTLKLGSALFVSGLTARLAEAYSLDVQVSKGLQLIEESLDRMQQSQERYFKSTLYHVKGKILLRGGSEHEGEAQSCFRTALELAQSQQQAILCQLRAATSLAELLQRQNKVTEACNLLSPACDHFTRECEVSDVMNAKVLLVSLSR
jgi:tetratricopeptide (TPR) repeat protein